MTEYDMMETMLDRMECFVNGYICLCGHRIFWCQKSVMCFENTYK